MEKIFDFKDEVIYRFQCDCSTPSHAIDLSVHKDGSGYIVITFWARRRFIERVKWAWKMLRTGEGYERDFCIRPDDFPELLKVISGAMENHTCTSST